MSDYTEEIRRTISQLREEIGRLKAELDGMKRTLAEGGDVGDEQAQWGWTGLSLEIMEALCDAGGSRLDSREITDRVNAKRGGLGFGTRTSPASVARNLTQLCRAGSASRMPAGRERYYILNPTKVIGISESGKDPLKLIDGIMSKLRELPAGEREETWAVYYTVTGLEPFLLEMDSRTSELAHLVGMTPEGDIRIRGVGQLMRDPSDFPETTVRIFLIRKTGATVAREGAT